MVSPEGLTMFVLRSMSTWLSLVSFSSFLSAHINLKVQTYLVMAPANKKIGETQLPAKYLAGKLALLDILISPLNPVVKVRPKGHRKISGV